jgi:putative FmdB family regulatory protein
MPLYEYECGHCGHYLETMQKVSEAPLRKCPKCGKTQLQRLISAPVFRLKGSGWYETDFKGDKEDKRNLADRPEGEKKESAEPAAKESGEGAKAEKGESAPEKGGSDRPAEKSDKTTVPAPSKRVDLAAKRSKRPEPRRAAKPAVRAKKTLKRAAKAARRR